MTTVLSFKNYYVRENLESNKMIYLMYELVFSVYFLQLFNLWSILHHVLVMKIPRCSPLSVSVAVPVFVFVFTGEGQVQCGDNQSSYRVFWEWKSKTIPPVNLIMASEINCKRQPHYDWDQMHK